jgi:4'-phosphopantetheinyl transferase
MPAGAERSWAPGPDRPRLTEGDVHVWRVELTTVGDDVLEALCEQERERAGRFLNADEGRLWARSRGVLRLLVGRYLQREPGELRFTAGEHGKPELLAEELSFNLSHSAGLALYAFTRMGSVGVDVEVARRALDEVALAARTFGPAEARRLAELDPPLRNREFLRLWVRREAELKCRGSGFAATADASGGELWIADLEVGERAAAAVALRQAPRELRCWDWQSQSVSRRS